VPSSKVTRTAAGEDANAFRPNNGAIVPILSRPPSGGPGRRVVPVGRRPSAGRRSPPCGDRGHQARRVRAVTPAAATTVDRRHPGRWGGLLAADADPVAARAPRARLTGRLGRHGRDAGGRSTTAARPSPPDAATAAAVTRAPSTTASARGPRGKPSHRARCVSPQRAAAARPSKKSPATHRLHLSHPSPCGCPWAWESDEWEKGGGGGGQEGRQRTTGARRGGQRGALAVAPPTNAVRRGAAVAAAATAGDARAHVGGGGHLRGTLAGPTPRLVQRATSCPSEENARVIFGGSASRGMHRAVHDAHMP